jgi:predicted DNA-binding protein (UPF0251 family)
MPPKGKGRKSNIEAYRDAMAIVKLVDHDCEEVEDAAKALGLTRATAYRLLSRARSMLLTPQIEADKKAAEPKVKDWFEPLPAPEPEPATVREREFEIPDVQPVPTPVAEPEPEPWKWSHLMSREEFLKRDLWRQKQLIAQWEQNTALGGTRWTPVLRGKPSNQGVCFNPNHSQFNCDCHAGIEDFPI